MRRLCFISSSNPILIGSNSQFYHGEVGERNDTSVTSPSHFRICIFVDIDIDINAYVYIYRNALYI